MNQATVNSPPSLADLERELATEAAVSDVETCCLRQERGSVFWYDLNSVTEEDKAWLARAVRYLDMRQLLERDPTNCSKVRILGGPEVKPKVVAGAHS